MDNPFFSFPIIAAPEIGRVDFPVSGQGKRAIGLIIRSEENREDCLQQLAGILTAAGFSMEEDAFLFALPAQHSVQASDLLRRYALSHLLLFDFPPARAGLVFPLAVNRPVVHSGYTMLLAPSLDAILREKAAGGKTLRLGLWQAIQQIFPKV